MVKSSDLPSWAGARPLLSLVWERGGARNLCASILGLFLFACVGSILRVCQLATLTGLYNALNGEFAVALFALSLYLLAVSGNTLLFFLRESLSMWLEVKLRNLLTTEGLQLYLANSNYLKLHAENQRTDHPDQRLTEDALLVARQVTVLGTSLLAEVLAFGSFFSVLLATSARLRLDLPLFERWGLSSPLLLPFLAVCTTLISTVISFRLGRRLAPLENERERCGAALGRDLLVIEEQAQDIAALKEEESRLQRLLCRLQGAASAHGRWLRGRLKLETFRQAERDLSKLIPLAVVVGSSLPEISMGQIVQLTGAFISVVNSGQWTMRYLVSLRSLKAAAWRLGRFIHVCAEPLKAPTITHSLQIQSEGVPGLPLSLWADQIELLLEQGVRQLVVYGSSGSGKTSLLRALQQRSTEALLVPQSATSECLKLEEWCDPRGNFTEKALHDALHAVGLDRWSSHLKREKRWGRILSRGEQQRFAIVSAVLQSPRFLLLDEPTASLDASMGHQVMAWIQRSFNGVLIVASHDLCAVEAECEVRIEAFCEELVAVAPQREEPQTPAVLQESFLYQ
jgi:vitamin B12/bleomycin/antimicrobial peptide transport system ATP-binding/permease protein